MSAPATASHDRSDHFRDLQRRAAKARSVNVVERRIRELVDSAPPLTGEQCERLALLLRRGTAA